jgi:N utilization substance protein B
MALKRSEARKKCMTILYQLDIYRERKITYDIDKVISENMDIENDFVNNIVHGVAENVLEIDELANKYMKDWTIDKIDKTGAAIMRMAIYELKYTDTPEIVVINEAIELAKEYSDDNVRKIVNAVLDKMISE